MQSQPFVEFRGISKAFSNVRVLEDVSFSVGRGEVVCLAGQNGCGKSTLIKILSGAFTPTVGEVAVDGQTFEKLRPIDAINLGVQVIYQDFSIFPNLTVAENIFYSRRISEGRRLVSRREARAVAARALERIGVDIPLDALLEDLPVASKQLVAIARALMDDVGLIVMDEPTTALTEREVQRLLEIVRRLKSEGISVLFVSHKLAEIFAVCDRIVVLRNGQKVADGPTADFTLASLTQLMLGRELSQTRQATGVGAREMLRLETFGDGSHFFDIDLSVRSGEVLGITGLLGSGRTELAKAISGITPPTTGRMMLDGRAVGLRSIEDGIAQGIAYVPEDRLTEGLFLPQSILRNIAVGEVDRFTNWFGGLDRKGLAAAAEAWVGKLSIKTPSSELPVISLSGGNQQRVVLARWLSIGPRLLVLNGPTVGVDVGSKAEIHQIIGDLAASGMAVIIVSDDLPELISSCHRILVMKQGRITNDLDGEGASEDELSHLLAS